MTGEYKLIWNNPKAWVAQLEQFTRVNWIKVSGQNSKKVTEYEVRPEDTTAEAKIIIIISHLNNSGKKKLHDQVFWLFTRYVKHQF